MAAHSKKSFLDIIEEEKDKLFKENEFVRKNEETELPDVDDEEPVEPEASAEEQPEEVPAQPEGEEQQAADVGAFTNREVDILNTALRLYRDNDSYSIESKNELGNLFDDGHYQELLDRLIGVADELIS